MEFEMILKNKPNEIFNEIINFENLPNLLPRQLKKMEIMKKEQNKIITKEVLFFKTIIKNEIIQESSHIIMNNEIITTIISGPAKNSIIKMKLKEKNDGTLIKVEIDLKLILKARILLPIIKKVYSSLLTGVLYKIENSIEQRQK